MFLSDKVRTPHHSPHNTSETFEVCAQKSRTFFRSNCQHIKFFRYFCIVTRRGVSQAYKAKTYQ